MELIKYFYESATVEAKMTMSMNRHPKRRKCEGR